MFLLIVITFLGAPNVELAAFPTLAACDAVRTTMPERAAQIGVPEFVAVCAPVVKTV